PRLTQQRSSCPSRRSSDLGPGRQLTLSTGDSIGRQKRGFVGRIIVRTGQERRPIPVDSRALGPRANVESTNRADRIRSKSLTVVDRKSTRLNSSHGSISYA